MTMGFKFVQTTSFSVKLTEPSWIWVAWQSRDPRQSIWFLWGSRLSKIEPSDVIRIPDSVMRTAEIISMNLIIYSSQGPICVSFSLTVYSVNWLKFSTDRVVYTVKRTLFNFFFSVFLYERIQNKGILCLWPFMVISEHHLAKLEEQT